ncbi:unnamed protein product [Microthlaspi erraticum]|uniref:Ubiquitin-like protease family profile domain-containing protein n=1 Tax=Microthlaspi erraticum TaxID=1685480 RepID=A0A6D2K3Y4_9BRAS|nr:unnamed protein product [Microthlaspi erraticum]
MENEFPRRLFAAGNEPEVDKINNSCRMSILTKIKAAMPEEYNELKNDSVFANIIALHENNLGYSARLIHSMMCRQLITEKKYEIWCVFGGRPLRFSLQEFYAVTGLKYKDEDGIRDSEEWKDDNGFWSKLLKRKDKISIKMLLDNHLPRVKVWNNIDRIRFVYVCVIAGLVLAKHETKEIPHKYIKLAMDIGKVQSYPWGLDAFELLADSIIEDVIYPYISFSGSLDLCESSDFAWPKETRDATVDYLKAVIQSGNGLENHVWGSVETVETIKNAFEEGVENKEKLENGEPITDDIPVSGSKRAKRKIFDEGAIKRKQKILCQRVGENHGGFNEDLKSFIQGFFKGVDEWLLNLENSFKERLMNLENSVSQIKESLSTVGTKRTTERFQASKVSTFSNSQKKARVSIEDEVFPSQTSKKKEPTHCFPNVEDILLSQPFDLNRTLDRHDSLQETMGHLSQDTHVTGFDATQGRNYGPNSKIPLLEDEHWLQPLNSGRSTYHPLSFDSEPNITRNDYGADYPLLHVSEDCWSRLIDWSSGEEEKKNRKLQLGPTVLRFKLLDRILARHKSWFRTEDMDAMMYIFRERTTLGRLKDARAGFMNCMFGMQIANEYNKFLENKRQYQLPRFLLAYGTGELPSHGRTRKRWALDLDRIYTLLNIGDCHWISLCISFSQRTIHVFDCSGVDNRKNVEAFKFLIPRIVKAVQPGADAKLLTLTPYSIINAPVKPGLNKSKKDCGAYALKFIECQVLGLDLSLINDSNIREARMKIASDLCEAATDPILQERMLQYKPSQFDDIIPVEID